MTENAPLSTSRYFRISITDRCNLSCYYCHKEGQWNGKGSEGLSASDLVWTVKTALGAGFSKIKLTGGEPTLRPDLPGIVSGMAALEVEDFSMITNGTLLGRLAPALRDAGLPRLNVSLNTLNPRRYAREHGGSATLLENVLRGIDIALDCGFADMKLNFVHNGPRSCGDFRDVTAFAAPRGLPVVLLPMIPYETRSGDETVSLEQLYEMLDEAGNHARRAAAASMQPIHHGEAPVGFRVVGLRCVNVATDVILGGRAAKYVTFQTRGLYGGCHPSFGWTLVGRPNDRTCGYERRNGRDDQSLGKCEVQRPEFVVLHGMSFPFSMPL